MGDQLFNQQQSEIDRCSGAAGSEQTAVSHDSFCREDAGQLICHGEMCGVTPPRQQTGIMQHGGRGADGGEPAIRCVIPSRECPHPRIGAQVTHTWAARQKQAVVIARFDGGERGVGMHREAGSSCHVDAVTKRGDRDFDSRTAQQVDGRGCFNFLKSVREDCENRGHGMNLAGMSTDAHGNLSGEHLVVFGCGYVGSELARQAVAQGMGVTALTRNPETAAGLSAAGVEAVVAELASDEWHARIPGGASFVLNCVSSGDGGVDGYRRSYVEGMHSILAWARGGPVGTLVYTGSTSVYPQGGGAVVDETAPTEGASETARVLLEAEALLNAGEAVGAAAALTAGCRRRFVLRLAGIYGPGRHHLLDQLRGGAGEIPGRGDQRLNLIHRDDAVAAIWAVFTAPPAVTGEIFNVADDRPGTRDEIVTWLAAKIGVPAPRCTGESGSGRRAVSPDRIISNEKLKARLGWRPVFPSFREGYAHILRAL